MEWILENQWHRSSETYVEEYEVPLHLLKTTCSRQVKHHGKVARGKQQKEERRRWKEQWRNEDGMLQKRRRRQTDRMRTLVKTGCMQRDIFFASGHGYIHASILKSARKKITNSLPLERDPDIHTTGEGTLQQICLKVRSLAGNTVAIIDADLDSSVADLKARIAREGTFEYGTIVKELVFGPRLLADASSLHESALCDLDVLVAIPGTTPSTLISGQFGSKWTTHIAFSDSSPSVEIYKTQGSYDDGHGRILFRTCASWSFQYALGEVHFGSEQQEVSLELWPQDQPAVLRGYTHKGVLCMSYHDPEMRRLVIPHLDIDVLNYVPEQLWESVLVQLEISELERREHKKRLGAVYDADRVLVGLFVDMPFDLVLHDDDDDDISSDVLHNSGESFADYPLAYAVMVKY